MTAIVTCGETRASLASVRALGRAHVPVAVGAVKRPTLSMWSRYATSTFLTEDPSMNAAGFAEQLADEARARYAECILYSTDEALWALSRFREHLPEATRRILPPHFSVARALDHEALHSFAESLGILCAPLVRIPEKSEVVDVLALLKHLAFPMLLRPIISWTEREDGTRALNSRVVAQSKEHLAKLLDERASLQNGFLVSAYTSVRALSYFGVADRGQVLVEGFQERLNEFEAYNEVATLAITINPVPSIRRAAENLLAALSWQGPFKLEFIKDQRGNYRLITLIGRLWGSLQLAIAAKVNIPLICYHLASGSLSKKLLYNAKPNVRMRWLLGDVAAKISNPRQIFTGFSSVKSVFDSLIHSYKISNHYDVFDVDDPMPFIFELQNKTWKRAFGERDLKQP